jgi:hypothetical protein
MELPKDMDAMKNMQAVVHAVRMLKKLMHGAIVGGEMSQADMDALAEGRPDGIF